MRRKIWKNRNEFYPACSVFIWYFVGAFLSSLAVQNRPGIIAIGFIITIPTVIVFFVAVIRTYLELPLEAGDSG